MRVGKADHLRHVARRAPRCPECSEEGFAYIAGTLYCERHALFHLITALQAQAPPRVPTGTGPSAPISADT